MNRMEMGERSNLHENTSWRRDREQSELIEDVCVDVTWEHPLKMDAYEGGSESSIR